MNRHETTKTELCTVEIDNNIRDIVLWMNDNRGLITLWSCEGDKINKPYVVFFATDPPSLNGLLVSIKTYATVEVEHYSDTLPVRYTLYFKDKGHRDLFASRIRG